MEMIDDRRVGAAPTSLGIVRFLLAHEKLAYFRKGLYKHPTPKMAGALQSGFPLCLPNDSCQFSHSA